MAQGHASRIFRGNRRAAKQAVWPFAIYKRSRLEALLLIDQTSFADYAELGGVDTEYINYQCWAVVYLAFQLHALTILLAGERFNVCRAGRVPYSNAKRVL